MAKAVSSRKEIFIDLLGVYSRYILGNFEIYIILSTWEL